VVSAAHPACILVPADGGAPRRLDLSGHVLGLIEEVEFGQLTLDVAPGDKLLLFSDGLPYAFRVDGPTGVTERLGMDGLETIMARHRGLPLEELVDAVFEEVMDFSRRKQTDDMLLLGVQAP
jgi:sigma-B regulation protein RsbU (phosphoserine phosphatase)